ncbi:3-hydroxybutyryl-CoA dehydrogenase [Caballeronia hypogeia]|uniref:3-hydroxybutyryl-CoA dehydrogenase n=1 Tax=Caballeronia hypogeia TaxID=1777140 RepID=A0A158A8W2_9BURK|nr:3-hydroxybutyryl-CoA dehydrogenase [Caballeronia hypogeia]SAK54169.1 3-hydroxybutyryl-CoA dehydrogenase [Caballeronia hypogeia]
MDIQKIGIVGAGQMGSGIAQVCAQAGLDVVLNDISEEAVQRGIDRISASLERMVRKDKLSADEASAALARIERGVASGSLAACDFVIEGATENVQIKRDILRQLDGVLQPGAIIATNTSSVSITMLAATLANPARFIGMHFFNPVPMMELIEVIRGIQTSDITFEATVALARRIGKTAIDVRNSPGFAVNRILVPMINEAVFVLQEGIASAEGIDAGMKLGANHPIGPLALADLIGLDTVLAIMKVLYRDFNDPKYRPAALLKEMVDAGYLGRKNGRGFYTY